MTTSNAETFAELLTLEEFAARMKVSRTTVFSWLKKGDLQEGFHYLRLGRILRFRWNEETLFTNTAHLQDGPKMEQGEKRPSGTPSRGGVNLDYGL